MSNSDYIIGPDYGIYVGTGQGSTIDVKTGETIKQPYSSFKNNLKRGGVTTTLDDKTNYQFYDQVMDTNTYTVHPEEKNNNTIIIMGAAAAILLIILMKQ